MAFVVATSERAAGDRVGTVYELTDTASTVRAEVWPTTGLNCVRWQARRPDGSWAGILFTAPDWETNPVPTRTGHPILFPFPGRLRDGRLPFEGKTYQLPLNDSTKSNAIHGFTPRNPWRVVSATGGDESASVTGHFRLAVDLPAAAELWPGDFDLQVTYSLHANCLKVTAEVHNQGPGALPFGLGYHPYFRLPGVTDPDVGRYVLQANAGRVWEADANNLPTGRTIELPPGLDFRHPRPIGATALDHVLTGVTSVPAPDTGLVELAVLSHPDTSEQLSIHADPTFRELVLFTPAHRHAVAIEPYTCSADASNLAAQGIDTGWRQINPGEVYKSVVEYRWG